MKAITVKYVGPTNYRPSHVVATDGDHRVTMTYHGPASARAAAVKLCETKWQTNPGTCARLIGGGTKTADVFVQLPSTCSCTGPLAGARRRRR